MNQRKRKRREYADAIVSACIQKIDDCLQRFGEELVSGEVKLADYMRLADLESIAAENDEKEVMVRWVDCDREEAPEDE